MQNSREAANVDTQALRRAPSQLSEGAGGCWRWKMAVATRCRYVQWGPSLSQDTLRSLKRLARSQSEHENSLSQYRLDHLALNFTTSPRLLNLPSSVVHLQLFGRNRRARRISTYYVRLDQSHLNRHIIRTDPCQPWQHLAMPKPFSWAPR